MWTIEKVKSLCKHIGFTPLAVKAETAELPGLLYEDEKLLGLTEAFLLGYYLRVAGKGLLFATQRRIVFYRKSIIGRDTLTEIELSQVTSITLLDESIIEVRTTAGKVVFVDCTAKLARKIIVRVRRLIITEENEENRTIVPS